MLYAVTKTVWIKRHAINAYINVGLVGVWKHVCYDSFDSHSLQSLHTLRKQHLPQCTSLFIPSTPPHLDRHLPPRLNALRKQHLAKASRPQLQQLPSRIVYTATTTATPANAAADS